MANPPPLLTEARLQELIDSRIQKAIASHERRFSLYGLPLILGVVAGLFWLR